MRRTFRLLAAAGAIGTTMWVRDARRRAAEEDQPLRTVLGRDFRRFVTHRFDPLVMRLGLAGGHISSWGVVEHVGRVSGTMYHTPVLPRAADGRVYIPLPYGTDVDWVRNVRAAGHCRVQLHEVVYELDEPSIVPAAENPAIPAVARGPLDRIGAHYLRLHVLDQAPGTFAHRTSATTVAPGARGEFEIELVHPPELETTGIAHEEEAPVGA
jgi:hypothetical protein